jgi:hypothetical protein
MVNLGRSFWEQRSFLVGCVGEWLRERSFLEKDMKRRWSTRMRLCVGPTLGQVRLSVAGFFLAGRTRKSLRGVKNILSRGRVPSAAPLHQIPNPLPPNPHPSRAPPLPQSPAADAPSPQSPTSTPSPASRR